MAVQLHAKGLGSGDTSGGMILVAERPGQP